MRMLLRQYGYDPKHARTLQREGMGPYELEGRLKHPPGSVGSLEYTHKIHRENYEANPLTSTQWVIGGAAVLGVAGLIYYFTSTPTKKSAGGSGSAGGAFVLDPNLTAQSVTIPAAGLHIALPVGGIWTGSFASFGSSPQFIPYTAYSAGTATIPITWSLNGVAKTTQLTLTSTYVPPGGGSGGGLTAVDGSTLALGGSLLSGHSLRSPAGQYTFTMQTDGNLVLYNTAGKALWASNTSNTGGGTSSYALLQTDGNFVVYNNLNIPQWNRFQGLTVTGSTPTTTYLTVQDDGNVVIYLGANGTKPGWSTNTSGGVVSPTWGK
jgi:hypothetical protein